MRPDVVIAFVVAAACGALAMLASWRASQPSKLVKNK
jgi:hypothetical protein